MDLHLVQILLLGLEELNSHATIFLSFNMEEKRTLLAKGEEITTPQTARASNSHVPKVHVH